MVLSQVIFFVCNDKNINSRVSPTISHALLIMNKMTSKVGVTGWPGHVCRGTGFYSWASDFNSFRVFRSR